MQKPYFLDPKMPDYVRKYMETMNDVTDINIDTLARYIRDNHKPRSKEKVLRHTVKAAYEWNIYLMKQEKKMELKNDVMALNGIENKQKDDEVQIQEENQTSVDAEIEEAVVAKQKDKKYVFSYQSTVKEIPPMNWVANSALKEEMNVVLLTSLMKSKPTVNVLLSGPERSGKTTLALVMKQVLEVEMHQIDIEEFFKGGPLKSPVKKLQEELSKIHSESPGILLIHNLEQLFTGRDPLSSRGPDQDAVVFASVLQNYIEQISEKEEWEQSLLVIGETSKPEVLSWKFSKCFPYKLKIPPPSVDERHQLLQYFSKEHSVGESVDLEQIALKASGYVVDDLKKLVHEAEMASERRYLCSQRLLSQPFCSLKSLACDLVVASNKDALQLEDFQLAMKKVTPSLKRQGFPSVPDTTWADIGGLLSIKQKLRDLIIKPIIQPNLHKMFGLKQKSGVLLWGPPGCGKTLLAKAVANEAGINLLIVNGPELLSMYQGESERAVREVFARAASVAPCVIFFDEFDSLCSHRAKSGDVGSKSTIVNMLLTEMDGFISRDGIYLMAATNMPTVLDPAALRPGRFDTKLYVDFPDATDRAAVIEAAIKNGSEVELASCVDLQSLAARDELKHFTGADCYNLVQLTKSISLKEYERSRAENAVSNGKRARDESSDEDESSAKKRKADDGSSMKVFKDEVNISKGVLKEKHFLEALKETKPSVSEEQRVGYEEQKATFQ